MNSNVVLTCLVACSLGTLAPFNAMSDPASGMERSDTTVVVKDSAITSSIKARLAADPAGRFGDVRIHADDQGIVTLEGHVRTQDAADRALSIAKNAEGVHQVRSEIKIEKDD